MSQTTSGKHLTAIGNAKKLCRSLLFAISALGGGLISHVSYADFYISSFGTNQVMRFDENSGTFLGVVANVNGPFASQTGFGGDLFVSSHNTGELLRFNSFTGEYKGAFIKAHAGGLTNPTAANFGPDGKVYIGDLATNRILRFDHDGNFIDVFADGVTSDLNGPFMEAFDENTLFVASGYSNSILRYDLKTKEYMGAFVPPGSGGLTVPVGLEFGPDGNLYASSSATDEVLRYNGKTGEFIDKFVPAGSGGVSSPRAIRFGGPNTDLYVISLNTNTVLQFDRTSGAFIRAVATSEGNGMSKARGLTFTPRPDFVVYAEVVKKVNRSTKFMQIKIDHRLKDYTDSSPTVKLVSIVCSDPNVDITRAVKNAKYGKEDYHFQLDFNNNSGLAQKYTISYTATNVNGYTTIATTVVHVPAS